MVRVHKSESQHELQESEKFKGWRTVSVLKIALVVSFLIIVSLLVALIVVATAKDDIILDKAQAPTADQVKTAAYVIGSMDTGVDPCHDFYEFACGTWKKTTVIPDDRASQNIFGVLRDDMLVKLKVILEEESTTSAQPRSVEAAKRLYLSCMNESMIEKLDVTPLKAYVFDKYGEWPVLSSNWSEDAFDLVQTAAAMGLTSSRTLWNYWVSADDKNSSINTIQFDQPDLGLGSRDYYLDSKYATYLGAYKNYMIATIKECNNTLQQSDVARDVEDIVAFETALANLTTPKEQRRDHEALYNRMTLAEMHTNISNEINWTRFVEITFKAIQKTIPATELVVVYAPKYLCGVAQLINSTPKRTVANFMLWRFVMSRVKNLPKRFRARETEFFRVLYGSETDRSRWKICANTANSYLGYAVGRLFVDKYFDEEAKSGALDMIRGIRASFDELLDSTEWMDAATRLVAKEKANAITEKIGYPDYIKNNTALDEEYTGLEFVTDGYFSNVMTYVAYSVAENLKQLGKPVDRERWSSTPAVVNAFYSSFKNQIVFPAGILQPPFYDKTRIKALNYGAIGMVIGHEITHGFDDQGRQYDKNGNLVQWWSQSAIQAFKDKANCIANQYGNYTATQVGMNLNGLQTLGENIADNGGLKQAYMAYKTWSAKNGAEGKIPGVTLTPDQLFFVGFAQVWCGLDKDSYLVNSIATGAHSPGQFRVTGTLSNSEEFSKAYKCLPGSRMNPVNKCRVW